MADAEERLVPRETLYYIIYVAIFGVVWGVGTSILATTLPPDPITRGIFITWFEVIILFLTKIVVRRPFSVTFALLIASTISIVTFSFGPPNPFKPLFFLAGFAFDLGTRFRTTNLTLKDLFFGFSLYLPTIYGVFIFIIYMIEPGIIDAVMVALPIAMLIYAVETLIFLPLLWKYFGTDRAPAGVKVIQRQIGVLD